MKITITKTQFGGIHKLSVSEGFSFRAFHRRIDIRKKESTMPNETHTLTSGREITIDYDDNGEPQTVSWMAGTQLVMLSENEVYDIFDILDADD